MAQLYLVHAGTKGMKWGVRRFQNKDGSLTQEGKKRYGSKKSDSYHEDYKKAHSKKSVKEMSDKELRERNNRLQSEKQYSQLTKKTSVGKKAVMSFIAAGATVAGIVGAIDNFSKAKPHIDKALNKVGDLTVKVVRSGMKGFKLTD